MLEHQAEEVFKLIKDAPENEAMKDRWNLIHPDLIDRLMILSVRYYALKWIDANLPRALYRPMFDDSQLEEIMKGTI